MNLDEIDTKVRQIFSTLFRVNPTSLADDSSPETVPGWDSLQHLNLVLAVEEEFDMKLTAEEVGRMQTVKLVRDIVLKQLRNRESGGKTFP